MRTTLAIASLVLGSTLAGAQATAPPGPGGEAGLRRIMEVALNSLPALRCGSARCAPATEAERANPPITDDEARGIIRRGVLSGAGQACGLDWQGLNFRPLMAHYRSRLRKSERQMALVGVIHGIAQDTAFRAVTAKGPCSDLARRNTEPQLVFRP